MKPKDLRQLLDHVKGRLQHLYRCSDEEMEATFTEGDISQFADKLHEINTLLSKIQTGLDDLNGGKHQNDVGGW